MVRSPFANGPLAAHWALDIGIGVYFSAYSAYYAEDCLKTNVMHLRSICSGVLAKLKHRSGFGPGQGR